MPFAGKRALFVLAHGADAHQVEYVIKYFSDHGALVQFASPGGGPVMLHSTGGVPRAAIRTTLDVDAMNLNDFDALFVPSGADLPEPFPSRLGAYMLGPSPQRCVALLGTAVELLTTGGVTALLPSMRPADLSDLAFMSGSIQGAAGDVVGHPASAPLFNLPGVRFLGPDPEKRAGHMRGGKPHWNDKAAQFVAYPAQVQDLTGKKGFEELGSTVTSALVLGRDGMALPAFVSAIGAAWQLLPVELPGKYTVDSKFEGADNGMWLPRESVLETDLHNIPKPKGDPYHARPLKTTANVAIAVTTGSNSRALRVLLAALEGSHVTIVGPQDEAYVFPASGAMPDAVIHCERDAPGATALIIAPGSVHSTRLLSADESVMALARRILDSSGTVVSASVNTVVDLLALDEDKDIRKESVVPVRHGRVVVSDSGFDLTPLVDVLWNPDYPGASVSFTV
jgi:putative intracellular protease/amidase